MLKGCVLYCPMLSEISKVNNFGGKTGMSISLEVSSFSDTQQEDYT
jgi:hypothetical protein